MEAIIFIGLQASGKSSFYRHRFIDSHLRLNMDMLKTRHREKLLFDACLAAKQPVVIDNTNPTKTDRQKYILPAKNHRFKITGYYFKSSVEECQQRNNLRQNKSQVPYGINFNDLPTWQKRGTGLYWQEYQKTGHNPKTGEDTVVTRNKIKVDLEIPMKDEYSQFIRNFLINNFST